MKFFRALLAAIILYGLPSTYVHSQQITLPDGFKAELIADNLGFSRQLAALDNGDLFVGGRQSHLLSFNSATARYEVKKKFSNMPAGGVELYNGYIYLGVSTSVYRVNISDLYDDETPKADTIISGYDRQPKHGLKTFDIDDRGNLYLNVGSPSNVCQPLGSENIKGVASLDPCTQLEQKAGIWLFDANKIGQKPSHGRRYATGIRNAVAIDWNDLDRQLYVVQHGRDRLNDLSPDNYDSEANAELPAEELFQVTDGDTFGWPYCYYDPFKEKTVLAPEYGGDGDKVGRCSQFKDPIVGFPAHYSPNDLLFYSGSQFPDSYRGGAFIAFHGSWNRAPHGQKGYNVAFLPFNNGEVKGNWKVFADGFGGKPYLDGPGDALARPCGLAQGIDGSLFILDSKDGKVWKITYSE